MSAPDSASVGHLLAAVDDHRRTALVVRLAKHDRLASVQVLVLRADELPLVLSEVDVPVVNDRWEFRASGLWVEAVCEVAEVHWSYGLEAFALAIDEPGELLGRGYGLRTPLGWELDFTATGDRPAAGRAVGSADGSGAWLQAGRVEGLVLTGPGIDGEVTFAGPAVRGSWARPTGSEPQRWVLDLPAPVGSPVEVALPGAGSVADRRVWWFGHDGRMLTARHEAGRAAQR